MNKNLLNQILLLSLILGGVLGCITNIPFAGQIAFLLLMCFMSPVVIVFMTRLELLEVAEVKDSVILGAIIGFTAFIGFTVAYIPITILLGKVFHFYSNYGIGIMINNSSFGMLILLSLFMAVLGATVNAFSGFATYFIMDFLKNKD